MWSGIPQGSLLGPILFIIYINDLVEQCNNGSEIYLYADDAKLFSYVKCEEDSFRLQKDIDSVIQWMEMWLLQLNTTKCKAMTYGRGPGIYTSYSISSDAVQKIESIKDLGVTFDNKLKFDEHINNKIKKAYQTLGIIKRHFIYLTPDSFVTFYKTMIRAHLEYAVSVWNPHYQTLIEKLEKVQKRAAKLVITIKKLHYEERLRRLKLPTLKYRRIKRRHD